MVLYYLGEMTCEEISKFLGVSPNTVKSRLQRAPKTFKERGTDNSRDPRQHPIKSKSNRKHHAEH